MAKCELNDCNGPATRELRHPRSLRKVLRNSDPKKRKSCDYHVEALCFRGVTEVWDTTVSPPVRIAQYHGR